MSDPGSGRNKIALMNLSDRLTDRIFTTVGDTADAMGRQCCVVGGYVRDLFLHRQSKDIDFVTVGSGIEVAQTVAKALGNGAHCNVFRNFGTAQVKKGTLEIEFVGARRESYQHDSRKPIVEDGTLDDDLSRRDFTINAMAISVNADSFGQLIDPFDGVSDLDIQTIRTPLDPDITFSDDPLRMMRAVRFATQLGFTIDDATFEAIGRNADRLTIISRERVADELMKIMASPIPSTGWILLASSGLLKHILPELDAMRGVETVAGRGHKDNFLHTMAVLDKVASKSDDVWLRWAALLHDIAKPVTKRWDPRLGWTFHNHNFIGAKMVPGLFRRLRLPMNEKMKFVQKIVELHMRPIALVEDVVTDSAVRRLLFDAGDDIEALMTLCGADITSRNAEKVRRHLANFDLVRKKMTELEERDRVRCFQPPVSGEEVMAAFGLTPCREVGLIKDAIKNAILDGIIANDRLQALEYMYNKGRELGLTPTQPIITE